MRERGIESFRKLDRRNAASWLHANTPQEMTIVVRLACMRGFFRYLLGLGEVKENIWDTFINPKPKRFRPYIFSIEEIRAILDQVRSRINARIPIRSRVHFAYYTMFHALYACGMRAGEACRLDISDVDFEQSLFVVRNTKFGKSRLVPFNSRARELLLEYLNRFRPGDDGMPPDAPFFLNMLNRRFRVKLVTGYFARTCAEAGVYRQKTTKGNIVYGGTTTHALRHSFAVHRLLKWYEEGVDVNAKLPLLATYMGHAHYHHTQKYLTVLPTMIDIAGKRFARKFESPLKNMEWPGGS
jgi:site-specific recombinase XerD